MKGIITICGSTKFRKEFEAVNAILTTKGYIVLTVGSFGHSIENKHLKKWIFSHKEELDALHKEKIDKSHMIFVVDVDGYIGESTRSEILHAENRFLPITFLRVELDKNKAGIFNDVDRSVFRQMTT